MHDPHQILDLIEQQFNTVASRVVDGDAEALAAACTTLQTLSVELAQLLNRARLSDDRERLLLRVRGVAQGLQVVRDNVSRRTAFIDQSVAILFPHRPDPTYSATGAGFSRGVQRPRGFSS